MKIYWCRRNETSLGIQWFLKKKKGIPLASDVPMLHKYMQTRVGVHHTLPDAQKFGRCSLSWPFRRPHISKMKIYATPTNLENYVKIWLKRSIKLLNSSNVGVISKLGNSKVIVLGYRILLAERWRLSHLVSLKVAIVLPLPSNFSSVYFVNVFPPIL